MPLSPSLPRPPHFAQHLVGGHSYRVARWRTDAARGSLPLLFFTGIGANIELLAPFLERLLGREIITFDMPGIGGSPEYGGPYRLSTMASVAQQILTDLGIQQVDVMGVSWGGMLAQEFAYRYPGRVGRLILAATSPGLPMIPGNFSTLLKMVTSHRYSAPGSIQSYLQTLYGGSSEGLETYASRIQSPTSIGYLHQVLAIIGWTSVTKLTLIPAKTLILMGDNDRLVPPANGEILKFLLSDGVLKILPNAGHLFVLTHAAMAAAMVEGFLEEPRRLPSMTRSDPRLLAPLSG